MTRVVLVLLAAATPCALAHGAEAAGFVPAGTAEGVSGFTWPGAAVAIAWMLKGTKLPPINVRVYVRDTDDDTPKS